MGCIDLLTYSESDTVLFLILEAALIAFCVYAFMQEKRILSSRNNGGFSVSVTRGDGTMGRFYAAYGVTSGLLIGLALSVDVAAGHRTVFTLLNAAVPAYLCLINVWFRNKLLGWFLWLKKREEV